MLFLQILEGPGPDGIPSQVSSSLSNRASGPMRRLTSRPASRNRDEVSIGVLAWPHGVQ